MGEDVGGVNYESDSISFVANCEKSDANRRRIFYACSVEKEEKEE